MTATSATPTPAAEDRTTNSSVVHSFPGFPAALVLIVTALALAPAVAFADESSATYTGTASPGARVAALIDGDECAVTAANEDGHWRLEVKASEVATGTCAVQTGDRVRFTVDRTSTVATAAWLLGEVQVVSQGALLEREGEEDLGETPPAVQTFEVDSGADGPDARPGDGSCRSREAEAGSASCTLRAAVLEANASAGAAVVRLPAGAYPLSTAGAEEDQSATGDLDIAGDFSLSGDGSDLTVVDASGLDRVLHVLSGAVHVSGVTFTGGFTDANRPGGGGLRVEEGAVLTLTDVVVRDNRSSEDGGGIANAGALIVRDSRISNNSAEDLGGGVSSGERGMSQEATVLLERSTVAENTSFGGGGGFAINGPTIVRQSTLSGNVDGGGAILVGTGGSLLLENSTVSGNDEMGLLVLGGQAAVVSSTFAENDGPGDAPGINNVSEPGGSGSVTVTGSVVADGCYGGVASGGGNIDALGSCGFEEPTDQSSVDPKLRPLSANGGATETHLPRAGSPAIDAVEAGPPADQRGVARPQGAGFDSGAVEVGPDDLHRVGAREEWR